MRNLARALLLTLLPLFLLAGAACGGNPRAGDADPTAEARVEVRNLGFADMTVYVLSPTSSRIRLGLAVGNSNRTFTIPGYLVRGGSTLRFMADPIGGTRTPVSEELSVAPGDLVTLTLPPS